MEFSTTLFQKLIYALKERGYSNRFLSQHEKGNEKKFIYLRHDVDNLPCNSLIFAEVESDFGIKGTFYFRAVQKSWDEEIIREIAGLGHEIGYHYEDLSLVAQRFKVLGSKFKEKDQVDAGIESFSRNMERLRNLVPVKTICMHGSPLNRWDSRLLWKYYDYKDFGIEGEPYFDLNMEEMLYLTDTGRRWNGSSVSVRDKKQDASSKTHDDDPYHDWFRKPIKGSLMNMTQKGIGFQNLYNFRTTNDIIRAADKNELPARMMMTFHPQRWVDEPLPWLKELIWQNSKNVVKYFFIKLRK